MVRNSAKVRDILVFLQEEMAELKKENRDRNVQKKILEFEVGTDTLVDVLIQPSYQWLTKTTGHRQNKTKHTHCFVSFFVFFFLLRFHLTAIPHFRKQQTTTCWGGPTTTTTFPFISLFSIDSESRKYYLTIN